MLRTLQRGVRTRAIGHISGLALLILLVLPVHAQNAPPPACASGDGFTAFDFWVGDWQVYSNDADRNLLGTNSVTKHYGDCLIMEHWKGADGSAGASMNYYNKVTDEWRQVWVSNGYSIDYTGGLDAAGAMVLDGYIYNYQQAAKTPFRGIWTLQEDGSVIQHFDIYNAEDEEWNVWFEGRYVRAETGG
jgi:hypothetical protein